MSALDVAARAHRASAGGGRGVAAAASLPVVEGRVQVVAGEVYAIVAGHKRGPLCRGGTALPPAGALCLIGIVRDGHDWLVAVNGWVAS